MRIAAFFASLFCILLSGNAHLFAGSRPIAASQHSTPTTQQAPLVHFANIFLHQSFVNDNSPSQKEAFLICEEVEDEDVSDISAKKYKPLAGVPAAQSYSAVINFHYKCPQPLSPVWRPVSSRYILQRTLRI